MLRGQMLIVSLAAAAGLLVLSGPSLAYPGINAGADAGYSLILPTGMVYPSAIHGAAARARIGYGFDETWGIEAGLGLSWYQPYTPYTKVEREADDKSGTTVTYYKGAPVEGLRIQDVALALSYAIDTYRLRPTLALGVSSARILETKGGQVETSHDLAIRLELAVDVAVNRIVSLGAAISLDTFLLGNSPYETRNNFLLRATFHWDVSNLGRRRKSR